VEEEEERVEGGWRKILMTWGLVLEGSERDWRVRRDAGEKRGLPEDWPARRGKDTGLAGRGGRNALPLGRIPVF
jgi:hypothetical protein